MKFSLAFLVALALAGAVNVHATPLRNSNELNEVFEEFLALVPQEKVVEIFLNYLENDAEVQAVVEYVQSDSFKELVMKVESIEDVINFYEYLQGSGLDIYGLVNKIHRVIGLPPLIPGGNARNVRITGGVAGLIADIKAVLPVDKIEALYNKKLETSPAFAKLVERLRSPRFQQLINALRSNEEFQKIVAFAKEAGVDVNHIKDLLSSLLGLQFPTRQTRGTQDLNDDLLDFLNLLPIEKITTIALDYLMTDSEVKDAVVYLQSTEFQHLVQEVEDIEEARDVLAYLEDSGLNAYEFLNKIHDLLGIPPFKPSYVAGKSLSKATGGIAGLIADIKAILPVDDIEALYENKLENSPAFAKLIERLSSQQFQDFVDAVLAKDEARVIIDQLKAYGVDLQAIADLLSQILGLKFPKPVLRAARNDLHDDLDDFIKLLPVDKMKAIAIDYLENDAQVQEAVEYMESDAFHKIVLDVEAMKEARDVLAFLQESGLDAYGFLNKIHNILGLPEFKPSYLARRSLTKATGGIAGLIADIKAILPVDDIEALYKHKLENSPAFAKLIERLSSQQFQDFVDAVLAKDEARVIIDQLKAYGVDLQAIADLLSQILGLKFPKPVLRAARNDLHDDLDDFINLLPIDKMKAIAIDYLENDAQVQEAVEYMESDAFHKIVLDVEAMKEARDVLAFLQESGLDAYGFLNKIHNILGLPEFKPSYLARRSLTKATGGIAGLIADIKAILPVDNIEALYKHKLENSPAFAKLIERLSSQQFQDFVDAVLAKDEARVIIDQLKAYGVDLQAIADLLSQILGLKFPKPVLRAARNDLHDDLDDFINLLPIDEMKAIAIDYLENDAQVQEAVEYMESDAFHKIVLDVEAMKEARDVLAFLQESGLDAYGFLNKIHNILGLPEFKPSYLARRSLTKATGGIAGLIADIKAILPVDDIEALYKHKLENSPAFAKLIERLSSQQFQDFVDAVLAKDEARVIIDQLKAYGVDLQAIADLLSQILGLKFPKPALLRASDELTQDLRDFLDLVPIDQVADIAVGYVLNDPEVQKAAVYVLSEEFRTLATAAEQNKEFRATLRYLEDSGLAATVYINKVNDFLKIPHVEPSALTRSLKREGGVRGMLDEIEALFPHEKIEALFEHKKENSKAFKYFIERLEASEFQTLIDELSANEDFQNLGYKAASYGIDLQIIVDFLQRVFGIEISQPIPRLARSLEDDLDEFVALVPVKQIRKIAVQYYLRDAEFRAAVAYVRSAEFAQLVKDLNEIPEYHDLLHSLEEAGLDVNSYIERLHKLIGISSQLHSRYARETGGLAGLIEEIKAILPVDDIKALYENKVENSEEFAGLVKLISSDKFQAVTDALFANNIFQDILHRLQSHGINLQVVSDFFLKIFGITTPPGIIDFRFRW